MLIERETPRTWSGLTWVNILKPGDSLNIHMWCRQEIRIPLFSRWNIVLCLWKLIYVYGIYMHMHHMYSICITRCYIHVPNSQYRNTPTQIDTNTISLNRLIRLNKFHFSNVHLTYLYTFCATSVNKRIIKHVTWHEIRQLPDEPVINVVSCGQKTLAVPIIVWNTMCGLLILMRLKWCTCYQYIVLFPHWDEYNRF